MKIRRLTLLSMLFVLAMACGFPLLKSIPPTPVPAGTLPISTWTPLPTLTPSPTLPPTPSAAQLTPKPNSPVINCRSGPDVAYPSLDTINSGQIAVIAGRDDNSTWWYVHNPNNTDQFCWVSASVSTTSGDLSNLPVIPALAVIAINVTVKASISFSMCGGPNAVTFSGTITTNGATKVSFQWEIRGDKTNTTSPQTLTFKTAGTKDAPNSGTYSADCGYYSISLHVISPNDILAKQNFKIGP